MTLVCCEADGIQFNFSFAPEAETDGSHAETRIAKAKAGQTGQQPMTKLDQRELWTVKPTDQPDSIQSRRQRLSGDFKDKNQPLKLPWNDISDSESWTSCSSKESKLSTVEPKKDPSVCFLKSAILLDVMLNDNSPR